MCWCHLALNRNGSSGPQRLKVLSPKLVGFCSIQAFKVPAVEVTTAGPEGCVPTLSRVHHYGRCRRRAASYTLPQLGIRAAFMHRLAVSLGELSHLQRHESVATHAMPRPRMPTTNLTATSLPSPGIVLCGASQWQHCGWHKKIRWESWPDTRARLSSQCSTRCVLLMFIQSIWARAILFCHQSAAL
jgi:hypothetical protein